MSMSEILAELRKLSPEERQEVRLRLAELDGEDWLDHGELTDVEKALIEGRFRDLEAQSARVRLVGQGRGFITDDLRP
jgi:hypothetical protein